MSLSIGSRIIGEVRIQAAVLRQVVGAYELLFPLHITIYATEDQVRLGRIVGARVAVCAGNEHQELGFARPEGWFDFSTRHHAWRDTPTLVMPLQPGQLAALERLRGTADLDFELLAAGVGVDENGDRNLREQWRIHIPRSEWMKQLKGVKARDTLLLEVPIPLRGGSQSSTEGRELQRAEEQFRNGDYYACVAACRSVIQELGHRRFQTKEWAGPVLDRLQTDRRAMTQDEREAALWGALRHYTHQAHHGDGEGGVAGYSRSEAQFVLALTATLVGHAHGVAEKTSL